MEIQTPSGPQALNRWRSVAVAAESTTRSSETRSPFTKAKEPKTLRKDRHNSGLKENDGENP